MNDSKSVPQVSAYVPSFSQLRVCFRVHSSAHSSAHWADHFWWRRLAVSTASVVTKVYLASQFSFLMELLPSVNGAYSASDKISICRSGWLSRSSSVKVRKLCWRLGKLSGKKGSWIQRFGELESNLMISIKQSVVLSDTAASEPMIFPTVEWF